MATTPLQAFFHLFTMWTLSEVRCTMVVKINRLPVLRSPEVQHEELLDRSCGFYGNRMALLESARD